MPWPDMIAILALLVMLVTAVMSSTPRVEAGVGTLAAGTVLASGAVGVDAAWREVVDLAPVVAFLVVVLGLGHACAAQGLFLALGRRLGSAARGSSNRLLVLTVATAAGTTAVLSLDATVVLLTPVVAAAAVGHGLSARPHEYACARLANSASLLFPVSNLTNLLAFTATGLTFVSFTVAMAPVWIVAVVAELGFLRLWFRRDLSTRGEADDSPVPPVPRFTVVVLASVLVGFAVTSPLGVEPFWVAAVGLLVLGGHAVHANTTSPRLIAASAQLPFAYFVFCWAVVVAAVGGTFVGDLVSDALPGVSGLSGLLVVAFLAALVANLLNNLPATLLLVPVVAPLGTTALLALLVGVNVGSNATQVGSLANLLWRRVVARQGDPVSDTAFLRFGLLTSPVVLAVCTLTLWATR